MRATRKLAYSLVFALVIFFLSMFVEIVPCQTAPNVPNSQYDWKMCSLNTDALNQVKLERKYFGYTSSLTSTYLMLTGLSFIAALTALHFSTRVRKD